MTNPDIWLSAVAAIALVVALVAFQFGRAFEYNARRGRRVPPLALLALLTACGGATAEPEPGPAKAREGGANAPQWGFLLACPCCPLPECPEAGGDL